MTKSTSFWTLICLAALLTGCAEDGSKQAEVAQSAVYRERASQIDDHLSHLVLSLASVTRRFSYIRTPGIREPFPKDPKAIEELEKDLAKSEKEMKMAMVILPILTQVSELELAAINSAKLALATPTPTAEALNDLAAKVASVLEALDGIQLKPEWKGLISDDQNQIILQDVTALRRDIQPAAR
jgi:hypothetical protein